MTSLSIKRLAMAATMLCFASAASAQYVWLDEKGHKQFSDMPPPVDVPKARILKSPGFTPRASAQTSAEGAQDNAADANKSKAPLSTKERNMDYQKRKLEQAEKDKKAADAQSADANKAQNCEKARSYSENLQSGARIPQNDKNGERSYMSDEQRAKELREARDILKDCK